MVAIAADAVSIAPATNNKQMGARRPASVSGDGAGDLDACSAGAKNQPGAGTPLSGRHGRSGCETPFAAHQI